MKITNARVIACCPGRNFVTLKIETDEGLTGLGDATLNGRELAVASYLSDHLIPCLLGRDPHLAPVTGVFAAQEIKPQARVLATDRGIRCVTLDYDAMKGIESGVPRLF